MAQQCAQALERARLYAEAQRLNTELEARLQQRTAELQSANDQLRRLASRLHAAREEERTRIAREIHDELGGNLTGLKMDVARLRRRWTGDPESRKETGDILHAIDTLVQTVRQIATELRPAILDDFGLAAAIEWQSQEFEKRSGITCQVKTLVEDVPLDRDGATAIFRVFQETLTNVARHAQASRVEVTLDQRGDCLVLEVSDNGRGISTSRLSSAKSLGLAGMRERISLLSGELEIRSARGQGTTVRITVPLNHTA